MSDDYEPNELRLAFQERSGYKPKTQREETQLRRITERWAEEGITPRDVRQALRGFWTTFPQDPATPLRVDYEFSGFIALVTPRPPNLRPESYYDTSGAVGPPRELLDLVGVKVSQEAGGAR